MRKSVAVISDEPRNGEQVLWITAQLPDYNQTPRQLSQVMFRGNCARCHGSPAAGKYGRELYRAACTMCHEPQPDGTLEAPQPTEWTSDWSSLARYVRQGVPRSSMAAFARPEGGPLTDGQIESLAVLLPRHVAATTAAGGGVTR
jgi:mono/diheme cytochrome c family protein